jgi:membrane fusion protein (multidrug efflux system)
MNTGTVTVRARFPNPEGWLLPGMYVRAEFSPVQAREAILAPQEGISRDAKGNATAMVIGADSKAELRTVITERTVGDQWLVSKGLLPGDRLIVEGLGRIKVGQEVLPVSVSATAGVASSGDGAVAVAPIASGPATPPAASGSGAKSGPSAAAAPVTR